ncbi:MAG: acyl-CoA desaturase [Planctomycetaceae bacterium]|nr:acyl-CoA desaturase [Planctomycetaceae bacterium]
MSETLVIPTVSTDTKTESQNVKFARCEGYMATLKERVDDYFRTTQLSPKDQPRMYLKTAIILAWLVASYVGLVFWSANVWQACACAISLGVVMAAVGFNIQHDGGHGAYSRYGWVNRAMAFTLDILGGSSFVWKRTHNIVHHSYTNITGVDGDIDLGILGRLSPHQPRRGFHRFQHLYLWFLYGFITFKWQFKDDTQALLTGKLGETRIPRPKLLDIAITIVGKTSFLTLAFVVPLMYHHWTHVAAMFFLASFVQGVLLSVVFQLAHCVEEAEFPLPEGDNARIENAWAVHQVETTVDFSQNGALATWFTGGLNFQIEHHLFPNICHIHYPAIAKIVRQTSEEFGIEYHAHPTVMSAIRSHFNWLKRMGRPEPKVAPAAAAA